MTGNAHALSGAVIFTTAAVPLSHYVHHLTPATAAAGGVVAAGAASGRTGLRRYASRNTRQAPRPDIPEGA